MMIDLRPHRRDRRPGTRIPRKPPLSRIEWQQRDLAIRVLIYAPQINIIFSRSNGSMEHEELTSGKNFGYPHPILPLLVRFAISRRTREGEGVGIGVHAVDAATVVMARNVGAAEDQGFTVGWIWVAEPRVAAR